MVKVINGKKYSTDTAKVVAYYDNIDGFRILQCNDAKFFEKTLYKKRTGEYFICTEGNNRSGVENGIEPVSEEEANKWSEIYLDADEYELIWGEVEE